MSEKRKERDAIDRAFSEGFLVRFPSQFSQTSSRFFLYSRDKRENFFLEREENLGAERIDFSLERL